MHATFGTGSRKMGGVVTADGEGRRGRERSATYNFEAADGSGYTLVSVVATIGAVLGRPHRLFLQSFIAYYHQKIIRVRYCLGTTHDGAMICIR